MFSYDVMTEEQAMRERFQLLSDGTYDGVIRKVTHRLSSIGNDMFELSLDIYNPQGGTNLVRDFWVFTKGMMWKTIHGCKSAGCLKEYEDKKLTPDLLVDRNVRVVIKTQEGNLIPDDKLKGKPPGSKYPDKNVVEDYVDVSVMNAPPTNDDAFNDEIPF